MEVGRVDFGDGKGVRKLKGQNKHLRNALRESGKGLSELYADRVAGWPFLVQALVNGGSANKFISLDQASDLMDSFLELHNSPDAYDALGEQIQKAIYGYARVETAKPDDGEEPAPNAEPQAIAPGPSAD